MITAFVRYRPSGRRSNGNTARIAEGRPVPLLQSGFRTVDGVSFGITSALQVADVVSENKPRQVIEVEPSAVEAMSAWDRLPGSAHELAMPDQ